MAGAGLYLDLSYAFVDRFVKVLEIPLVVGNENHLQ
jgi:hypothetical protein